MADDWRRVPGASASAQPAGEAAAPDPEPQRPIPRGRWSGVERDVQAGLLKQKERPKPAELSLSIDDEGTIIDSATGKKYPDPFRGGYCQQAKDASMKCLSDNAYQNEACEAFFDKYKQCKRDWNESKGQYRWLKHQINRSNFWSDLFG